MVDLIATKREKANEEKRKQNEETKKVPPGVDFRVYQTQTIRKSVFYYVCNAKRQGYLSSRPSQNKQENDALVKEARNKICQARNLRDRAGS